jgi:hypothetical protein
MTPPPAYISACGIQTLVIAAETSRKTIEMLMPTTLMVATHPRARRRMVPVR